MQSIINHILALLTGLFVILSLPSCILCGMENLKGCSMRIVVHPSVFYEFEANIPEKRNILEGSLQSELVVRQKIKRTVSSYINAANSIFGNYRFWNSVDDEKRFRLFIKEFVIMSPSDCKWNGLEYCSFYGRLDSIEEALKDFSDKTDHSGFCLSYLITAQDIKRGYLGLAWTATTEGHDGGLCYQPDPLYRTSSPEESTTTSSSSLNTGVITLKHNGALLPQKLAELAFAHEIGHSLGSPHDFPDECISSKTGGGNYLMHPLGALGIYGSNYDLSRCSISNISLVMKMLPRRGQDCLRNVPVSTCGNGIVEGWEECDCGSDEDCARLENKCCFPPSKGDVLSCTLKPSAKCSPSEGDCCTHDCQVASGNNTVLCRGESECSVSNFCDGIQAQCPFRVSKPNGTPCQNETMLCHNGECSLSICSKFNMEQCISQDHPCEISCQRRNDASTCSTSSSHVMRSLFGAVVPDLPLLRPPGSICYLPSPSTSAFEDFDVQAGVCDFHGDCLAKASTDPHYLASLYSENGPVENNVTGLIVGFLVFGLIYAAVVAVALYLFFKFRTNKEQRENLPNN